MSPIRALLLHEAPRLALRAASTAVLLFSLCGLPAPLAYADGGPATLLPPFRVAGASGEGDERDADIYPAVAFDPVTGRHLVVWMSLRNAGSSSDGFDVYGMFLDALGQPTGGEFRISDSNNVARNSLPSVAAGNRGFVVAWARRGGACTVQVQRVNDATPRADRVLVTGAVHNHSPNLIYSPARGEYVLAYVEGDDYMPSTLFGAQTADCGNSASSSSRVRAVAFGFADEAPVLSTGVEVTDVAAGAFRPRLAYSAGLNQYMVLWEDRRNAGGTAARFDVYAQKLTGNLASIGGDVALTTGIDYANYDSSATWTPRPAIAASAGGFTAVWFEHELRDTAHLWYVNGRMFPLGNLPGSQLAVARMTYAQPHAGRAPSGALAAAFLPAANEYLVGLSTHIESVWGYISLALVQRVTPEGLLLRPDGTTRQPGIGSSVDYANDDQIGMALSTIPVSGVGAADFLAIYAKHAPGQPSTDFDIWGARVRMPAPGIRGTYLPLVRKATGGAAGCLVESAHPYANSYNNTWTLTNPDTSAVASRVHFTRIDTENGYDYVYVRTGSGQEVNRFTGSYPAGTWSSAVSGRTVRVQLVSDGSVVNWGLCVDRIETVTTTE